MQTEGQDEEKQPTKKEIIAKKYDTMMRLREKCISLIRKEKKTESKFINRGRRKKMHNTLGNFHLIKNRISKNEKATTYLFKIAKTTKFTCPQANLLVLSSLGEPGIDNLAKYYYSTLKAARLPLSMGGSFDRFHELLKIRNFIKKKAMFAMGQFKNTNMARRSFFLKKILNKNNLMNKSSIIEEKENSNINS